MTKLENLINQMTEIINLAYEEGYQDALKTNTEEIKVGDKVRTLKDRDVNHNKVFPIGTIGKVTYVDDDDELPYEVEADNDRLWYSRDMLEVIESEE